MKCLKKSLLRELDQSDLDKKFAELNQLSKEKDAAEAELNKILVRISNLR